MNELVNLYGHTRDQLEMMFVSQGQQAFRGRQLMKWIYHDGVTDFSAMTDLPLNTRKWLAMNAQLEVPKVVSQERSSDGTVKWAVQVNQDEFVETVLIPEKGRNTLCVSSQVGCSLDCSFCATGKQGFNGNLSSEEIVGQLLLANDYLSDRDERITNVVFMGMGEPLANLNNLMQAIQIINASWGIGIGARHITVSTSGLVPQIRKIAEQPLQIRLAISLHGASDEVREKIMPVNKKYPISKLFDALHYYKSKKSQKITFEYILIKDVNDSLDQAKKLSKEARSLNAKVNLIPYNTVDGLDWERPSENTQRDFLNVLTSNGIQSTLRKEKGHDIEAACGQLRLRKEKQEASEAI